MNSDDVPVLLIKSIQMAIIIKVSQIEYQSGKRIEEMEYIF